MQSTRSPHITGRMAHGSRTRRASVVSVLATALLASLLTLAFAPAASAQATGIVVNELSPRNDSAQDEDGDTSDWIELLNTSAAVINIDGWAIGDSSAVWTIPETYVQPGDTVVFWASDKDRLSPQRHTNFKLSGAGETVNLYNAAGQLVDSMAYPTLAQDVTWGRGSAGGIGILQSPTRDAQNNQVRPAAVTFTPASGTAFDDSLTVTMSAPGGSQIRYTTNGSRPTASSTPYDGPITIFRNERIRAIAIDNNVSSAEALGVYNEIATTDYGFTSNLPIVLMETGGLPMTSSNVDVSLSIYDTGANGRSAFTTADHAVAATARVRGASSASFPKPQFKIDLVDNWDDDGSLDEDLLGLGAESDWVLYAPGRYDSQLIQNPFMHGLFDDLGNVASGFQFVELYLDDDGNGQYDDNEYDGIYILLESIKISDERVDITKLDSGDNGGDAVTGGYIFSMDWNDGCCANIEQTPAGSYLKVDTPKLPALTTAQQNYATSYLNEVESALTRSFTASNGPEAYMDIDSFIVDHILQTLAKEIDTFRASNYFYKDRNDILHKGPAWDYDRSLNSSDGRDDICDSFSGLAVNPFNWYWWGDLWSMPEYRALFYMKWQQEREAGGELGDAALTTRIDGLGSQIAEAWSREQDRWGAVGGYIPRYDGTLSGELNAMKSWLFCRTAFMDGEFSSSGAPSISNTNPLILTEGQSTNRSITASDNDTVVFRAENLPVGMTIDRLTGDLDGAPLLGTAGVYAVKVVAVDSTGASSSQTMNVTVNAAGPANAKMVLNEYNAVKADLELGNNGTDTALGRITGNGGDWLELVVIEDELDIRGWTIELMEIDDTDATVTVKDSLELTTSSLFASLRAGTIITIAEDQPEDDSYDPSGGDWTINLRSNNLQDGNYIVGATQQNFNTDENGFMVAIRDASGLLVSNVAGETETWDNADGGVSDNEVLSLCVDPTANIDGAADYVDHTTSSYGEPNACPGGFVQPMALRPVINQPPEITNPGNYSGPIEDAVSIPLTASDPDAGDTLTVTVSGLPQSLTFNPATNTISGTIDQPGTSTVTATVTDPFNETDSVTFTIAATNAAPVISAIGNQSSATLVALTLPITVSDPNAHAVTITATGLPPGIAVVDASKTLSGIISTSGSWTVTVTAEDPFGLTDTDTFVWSANTGPTISSPGNQTAELTDTANLAITASDPDGGTLTYSATGLPGGVSINATTGVVSGTHNASGQFNVTITVSDGTANATTTFVWLVNSAPTLTVPVDQLSALNQAVSVQPTAADADANNLTWTATGLPTGVSINANTGALTGSTTASGVYTVTLQVQDPFGETDTGTFTWTVNSAPAFNSISNQVFIVNQPISVTIDATDADGDALTYTATGLPTGTSFDTATGEVTGTPTSPGIFSVLVDVEDPSGATDQITVTFTVSDNDAAAAISTGCIGTNGRVDYELLNPNPYTTTFEVDFPNLPTRTITVAAGQTAIETITGRPDGNYTTTVTASGTTVTTQTIAVTCDTPITYSHSCVASNGLVRVVVNNSATTAGNYAITIDGITKTLTLDPFETGNVGVSGRNDGPLTIDVTRNGTLIATHTELIDCDPDIEVLFGQSCLAGNGRLDFTLTNITGAPATYTVSVDGLPPRDLTFATGEIRKTSITGRPDRDYPVTVAANGTTVWTDTITVDCDPNQEITINVTCFTGNGRIDIDINNTTTNPAIYAVTFNTFAPRSTGTLAPGATSRQTITGRPDGPFPITITRDNTTISTSTQTIACD